VEIVMSITDTYSIGSLLRLVTLLVGLGFLLEGSLLRVAEFLPLSTKSLANLALPMLA